MTFKVRNMSMTYPGADRDQDVLAVSGVDLDVGPDEFVTLIGPSGCGKSTLLHCLGGLLKGYEGSIEFDGAPVTGPNPRQAAFVFQDYSLLPWKSVLDNTAIGLRFAGISKQERHDRAMELLRLAGLEEFAHAYPAQLSGGMQQRVAVARGMVMGPRALLMDEPFGALDEMTRRDLGYELSRLLTKAGQSVVMVTHSLDEAIFWADRIVVMSARPGRISAELVVKPDRPRDLSFIASEEFATIRAELFTALSSADSAAHSESLPKKVESHAIG